MKYNSNNNNDNNKNTEKYNKMKCYRILINNNIII